MPTKECAHWVLALYLVKRPGTHLHTLRSRPCKQMLAPPHTLHCGRRRPCMHTCDPPHSLHVARMRPCAQNDPPPAGGDSVSSEGRDSGRTGASLSPMAGRRERLRQRVLGRQRACKLSACAMMTDHTSGRRCDSFRARTTRCHHIPHKCAARDGAVYIATCRHPRAEACPCLCRRNKGASTCSNKIKAISTPLTPPAPLAPLHATSPLSASHAPYYSCHSRVVHEQNPKCQRKLVVTGACEMASLTFCGSKGVNCADNALLSLLWSSGCGRRCGRWGRPA